MEQHHSWLASVPSLLFSQESPEKNGMQGTIVFYHGLGGSKEDHRGSIPFCLALAQAGFLVVSVDLVGHGERRYPDFAPRFLQMRERKAADPGAFEADVLTVVRETAQEVPRIIDDLLARGWAHPTGIGLAGLSLGADVVYAAIVAEPRIAAATAILGSPEWKLPWPESPHHFPERFFPVALLSQTAEADTHVSPAAARSFHQRLTSFYASVPDRLAYIEFPGVDHDLSESAWRKAVENMVSWFHRFLRQGEDKARAGS
jgi:dienelactone hydrolase